MSEWSVDIEGGYLPELEETIEAVSDELVDALSDIHVAVLGGGGRLGVTVTVEAPGPEEAIEEARERFQKVLAMVSRDGAVMVDRVGAVTVERQEIELSQPNFPELIGVSELAEMLGVTRQRASDLSRQESFARPVAVLRSGPVWTRSSVERFVAEWPRRPGRPHNRTYWVMARLGSSDRALSDVQVADLRSQIDQLFHAPIPPEVERLEDGRIQVCFANVASNVVIAEASARQILERRARAAGIDVAPEDPEVFVQELED